MNNQTILVFMTPVKAGKTDELKKTVFSSDEEVNFFSEIGISKYHRWIQKIRDNYFLIHQIEGTNPKRSFEILRKKITENHPIAISLHYLYKETLGIDLWKDDLIPNITELTGLLSAEVDNKNNSFLKEYCFIYPLIPSKKEKLLQMYTDTAVYHSKKIQDIYRFRGISKHQIWIQESAEKPYIVIYQEITGPVIEARDKYLNSKNDEFSSYIAREYSDMTGLSYEELLPTLESLYDFEILN